MKGRTATVTALAAIAALALTRADAHAQTWGPRTGPSWESPQNFALELRIGSFTQNIDEQLGLGGRGPYQQIFCSTRDAGAAAGSAVGCPMRFRVGIGGDWQIVRLGPIGSLGVGAFAQYGNAFAKAPATSGMSSADPTQWRRTAQDTALHAIHTSVYAVLRVDEIARRVRWLPIAPYAKAGLAFAPWWVSSGEDTARDPVTSGDAVGLSHGFMVSGGLSVLLDAFEPHTARQWDQTSGVNHSYLFFELNYQYLGGFTRRTIDLGGLGWTAGVLLEL